MLVLQLAEHVFVGESTIGISLFKLETPYADPHVRCCERCDAKTSAYSIVSATAGVPSFPQQPEHEALSVSCAMVPEARHPARLER